MPRNRKPLKVKSIRLVDSSEQYPDRDKVIVECIPCQKKLKNFLKKRDI